MTTTSSTSTTATGNLRAALLIVEHAERIGLPAPCTINVGAYSTSFSVDTLEELTDWAAWLEEPIKDSVSAAGNAHYNVDGLALDHPINVHLVVLATKGASR